MNKTRFGRLGLAWLVPAASIAFAGCKTKRTVTTTEVRHPIIEKFASNFDTSEGVATSDERSTYDTIEFKDNRAFETEDIDLKQFDARVYEDTRDYEGARDFEGVREFTGTKDHKDANKEALAGDGVSRFSDREASEMKASDGKSGLFSKMFRTRDLAETDRKFAIPEKPVFSGPVDEEMNAPLIGDQPDAMTEDDIRTMLGRRR